MLRRAVMRREDEESWDEKKKRPTTKVLVEARQIAAEDLNYQPAWKRARGVWKKRRDEYDPSA